MKKSLWYTRMGVGTIIAAMLLSGCQQNPDSSIVVNKDMDHLIASLFSCPDSNLTPEGKTIISMLTDEELERRFKC